MFQNKRKIIILKAISYYVSYMVNMWWGYIIIALNVKMTQPKTIHFISDFSLFLINLMYNSYPRDGASTNTHFYPFIDDPVFCKFKGILKEAIKESCNKDQESPK